MKTKTGKWMVDWSERLQWQYLSQKPQTLIFTTWQIYTYSWNSSTMAFVISGNLSVPFLPLSSPPLLRLGDYGIRLENIRRRRLVAWPATDDQRAAQDKPEWGEGTRRRNSIQGIKLMNQSGSALTNLLIRSDRIGDDLNGTAHLAEHNGAVITNPNEFSCKMNGRICGGSFLSPSEQFYDRDVDDADVGAIQSFVGASSGWIMEPRRSSLWLHLFL